MYADVDVFISNYTLVDPEIYELWIEGRSCKSPMSVFTPCFEVISRTKQCNISGRNSDITSVGPVSSTIIVLYR